jgi:nicotinamidase-related amidase
VYRAVFGDRPQPLLDAVTAWPASCGLAAWEALPRIASLLEGARSAGIPVIHVTGEPGVPHWRPAIDSVDDAGSAPATATGDPFEIMPDVAPLASEAVVRKAAPSAFWGTPLLAHLTSRAIDTVIVAGESTSGCVRATAVDAATYRYRVVVVEDCVFDRHEASHAINLFDLNQKYADVVSLEEVLGHVATAHRNGRTPTRVGV